MKADTRPQWLIDLDVVATTPEQARQIIKRNRALLEELKEAEPKLLKKQVPDGLEKMSHNYTGQNGEEKARMHVVPPFLVKRTIAIFAA